MIFVGDLIFFLSKQTVLRVRQVAQQIAASPIMYKLLLWPCLDGGVSVSL
jgi:hypothetical protein